MPAPAQITRDSVTAGISSRSNIRALCLCIASILNGVQIPRFINVRLDGEFPGINDFYLEQLCDLALIKGSEVSISICKSTGTRDARDWQLEHCKTDYLHLLDDDVVVDYRCLESFLHIQELIQLAHDPNWAFLSGSKADINNRRKYPNFDKTLKEPHDFGSNPNHSWLYNVSACWGAYQQKPDLDTGNVLFFMPLLRANKCTFRQFEDHTNCSGDATTFWLQLAAKNLIGYFVPSAAVYHLEKKGGAFNEFAARGEMLLRLCDLKGWDKELLKKHWMPVGNIL
jgi:hypothetical protein